MDNYNNVAGSVQENYARELLELHTLGVNGPYTEMDVVEVARCFTGWTFHGVFTNGPFGKFTYVDGVHDNGPKVVLGQTIPSGGGITDGEAVLDLLAMHPATAEFISTKMAKWLLTYDPPQALVHQRVGRLGLLVRGPEGANQVRVETRRTDHLPILPARGFPGLTPGAARG